MKTVEREITITTASGNMITMTVKVARGWEKVTETSFCDGDNLDITTRKEIRKTEIILNVAGRIIKGDCFITIPELIPADLKAKGVVAFLNNNPVTEGVYNQLAPVVAGVIGAAETDEGWMNLQAAKAKARKVDTEYEAHTRAVENMMTCGGRSY